MGAGEEEVLFGRAIFAGPMLLLKTGSAGQAPDNLKMIPE